MTKSTTKTKTRTKEQEVPPPPPKHEGSRLWSAKVDEDAVRLIRKMHDGGWSISALAEKFNTTWLTMSRIVKRESWKRVQ